MTLGGIYNLMDNYGAFVFWNMQTSTDTTNNDWDLTRGTWCETMTSFIWIIPAVFL